MPRRWMHPAPWCHPVPWSPSPHPRRSPRGAVCHPTAAACPVRLTVPRSHVRGIAPPRANSNTCRNRTPRNTHRRGCGNGATPRGMRMVVDPSPPCRRRYQGSRGARWRGDASHARCRRHPTAPSHHVPAGRLLLMLGMLLPLYRLRPLASSRRCRCADTSRRLMLMSSSGRCCGGGRRCHRRRRTSRRRPGGSSRLVRHVRYASCGSRWGRRGCTRNRRLSMRSRMWGSCLWARLGPRGTSGGVCRGSCSCGSGGGGCRRRRRRKVGAGRSRSAPREWSARWSRRGRDCADNVYATSVLIDGWSRCLGWLCGGTGLRCSLPHIRHCVNPSEVKRAKRCYLVVAQDELAVVVVMVVGLEAGGGIETMFRQRQNRSKHLTVKTQVLTMGCF